MNFYIRGGEILGVAGIAGSGQKELCEAIAGLRPVVEGENDSRRQSIVVCLRRRLSRRVFL